MTYGMYGPFLVAEEPPKKTQPLAGLWHCAGCDVGGMWQHDPVCWNCGLDPRETISGPDPTET